MMTTASRLLFLALSLQLAACATDGTTDDTDGKNDSAGLGTFLASMSDVRIRAQPALDARVVHTLAQTDPVEVLEIKNGQDVIPTSDSSQLWTDDWARVRIPHTNISGWVWSPLLMPEADIIPDTGKARTIRIDLTTQTLDLFEDGEQLAFSAPVTTGRDGEETPVGRFSIGERDGLATLQTLDGTRENVLFTQFFEGRKADGLALVTDWWHPADVYGTKRTTHGSIGMDMVTARQLWVFAFGAPTTIEVVCSGDCDALPSAAL